MKKYLIAVFVVSALSVSGVGARSFDIVYGPWIQNVTESELTLMWTTEGKSLSWVEVAPDDGTPFEAASEAEVLSDGCRKTLYGDFPLCEDKGA